MNAYDRPLTQRVALDRTITETVRCALGNITGLFFLHKLARWELREFEYTRTEGRKVVKFSVWMNVQEAICCGRSRTDRVA